jgi:hypothetical protein
MALFAETQIIRSIKIESISDAAKKNIYIYIYDEFYLHSRVATLTISIPSCVCPHTHLSL